MWIICPECKGEGKRVHPALSVWTQDDLYEDPDGFEEMMEGQYDIGCATCKGSGKMREEEMVDRTEEFADLRLQAAEDGDFEAYCNPDLLRY